MSLQYWLVSYLGAYSIIRYGKAAIPLTFALILEIVLDLNHYSTGRTGISTAIFVILAAVILARLNYLQRDRQWREDAVKIEQDTRSAFFRSSTMLIILFVFLGWMLSSYVQQLPKNGDDVNYFSTLFRDLRSRFENAANPLRGGNPVPTEHFGDFFSLGTGSELTDNVVMTVEANMRSIEGLPFYWRVRSYDKYENGIWASTVEDGETLADNDTKLTNPGYLERQLVTFDFYPRKNLTMLYAPGFPYRISRPVFIYRETVEGKIVDIPVVTVATILRSGGQYQLASLLGASTEKQLREASTDYPQWVVNRYLQYSEDLPESIGVLAQEITRDAQNIYDKTIAINNYLRNNIAYKQVIP